MIDNQNENVFDHPPTSEEVGELLSKLYENDPSSIYYKRTNTRPKLNLVKVLFLCAIFLCVATALGLLLSYLSARLVVSVLAPIGFLFLSAIIHVKHVLIWFIKLYQRLAPERVRNKCRFEPSCSQYMILALQKYGFFKGLKKGINRLKRCKPPNGGVDYP